VSVLDEQRHGLSDGDYVVFSELRGMVQLNGSAPRRITSIGPFSFKIGDTSSFNEHTGGGRCTQVKMPTTINFKSLQDSLKDPQFCTIDLTNWGRELQLHLGFLTVHAFRAAKGRLPLPGNESDEAAFLALAAQINGESASKLETLDTKVLALLASQASSSIAPICSVIGGIVAQEVMKACSGKFTPVHQILYFDSYSRERR